ncbi:hypothetical protein ACFLWY_01790 [Chloroflexota bacterium]
MMEPALDLIISYESRIAVVEELITTAYQATETSDVSFDILDEEGERLKTGLQKTLAKNCSLRRKDFNRLLERLLSDSTKNREAIEEERSQIREKVKEYLDEQKQLANYLRQQLSELTQEKMDKGCLDAVIGKIKASYEDTGQRLFTILRNFQLRLEAYQREQEEINHKLQRLLDRGETLSIEDLRQLEATKALQDRKTIRDLRREEVERLLAHFKLQRLEIGRHWRQGQTKI